MIASPGNMRAFVPIAFLALATACTSTDTAKAVGRIMLVNGLGNPIPGAIVVPEANACACIAGCGAAAAPAVAADDCIARQYARLCPNRLPCAGNCLPVAGPCESGWPHHACQRARESDSGRDRCARGTGESAGHGPTRVRRGQAGLDI